MLSTSFHFNKNETFVASYFYQLMILFENNKAVVNLVVENNPTLWHCQFSLSKNNEDGLSLCVYQLPADQLRKASE
jgi:hypothetical protein